MEARPRLTAAVLARSPAVVAGLRELLRREGATTLDTATQSLADLEDRVDLDALSEAADVLVVDLEGGEGRLEVDALDALDMPTVVLADTPRLGRRARGSEGAARGWLARDASAEELAAAVRAVAAGLDVIGPGVTSGAASGDELGPGESPLTEREREVLQLVAGGLPNKGIARELGISEHTVKFHVGAVLSKLQAQSRTEAVSIAARRGLLVL